VTGKSSGRCRHRPIQPGQTTRLQIGALNRSEPTKPSREIPCRVRFLLRPGSRIAGSNRNSIKSLLVCRRSQVTYRDAWETWRDRLCSKSRCEAISAERYRNDRPSDRRNRINVVSTYTIASVVMLENARPLNQRRDGHRLVTHRRRATVPGLRTVKDRGSPSFRDGEAYSCPFSEFPFALREPPARMNA